MVICKPFQTILDISSNNALLSLKKGLTDPRKCLFHRSVWRWTDSISIVTLSQLSKLPKNTKNTIELLTHKLNKDRLVTCIITKQRKTTYSFVFTHSKQTLKGDTWLLVHGVASAFSVVHHSPIPYHVDDVYNKSTYVNLCRWLDDPNNVYREFTVAYVTFVETALNEILTVFGAFVTLVYSKGLWWTCSLEAGLHQRFATGFFN